jgi:hypothetical protein
LTDYDKDANLGDTMPSFIKSQAGRGRVAEAIILPLGRIVADHAADEGIDSLHLAEELGRERFSGYILLRDLARTRQGIIVLVGGQEAGAILQVGREILTGTDVARRITADHPAVALAITAHDLGEGLAMAASAPLVGERCFIRMPTVALNLPVIADHWRQRKYTGIIWAGKRDKAIAAYFYRGAVLGEIGRGEGRLYPGTSGLADLWQEGGVEAEGFIR